MQKTGDYNHAHLNDQAGKEIIIKGRTAHGHLTAGLISAILETKLSGPGIIYLDQNLSLKISVYFGDTIIAK